MSKYILFNTTTGYYKAINKSVVYKGATLVCTRHRHNLESLKQALVEAVDNSSMDVVCTAIDEWPD